MKHKDPNKYLDIEMIVLEEVIQSRYDIRSDSSFQNNLKPEAKKEIYDRLWWRRGFLWLGTILSTVQCAFLGLNLTLFKAHGLIVKTAFLQPYDFLLMGIAMALIMVAWYHLNRPGVWNIKFEDAKKKAICYQRLEYDKAIKKNNTKRGLVAAVSGLLLAVGMSYLSYHFLGTAWLGVIGAGVLFALGYAMVEICLPSLQSKVDRALTIIDELEDKTDRPNNRNDNTKARAAAYWSAIKLDKDPDLDTSNNEYMSIAQHAGNYKEEMKTKLVRRKARLRWEMRANCFGTVNAILINSAISLAVMTAGVNGVASLLVGHTVTPMALSLGMPWWMGLASTLIVIAGIYTSYTVTRGAIVRCTVSMYKKYNEWCDKRDVPGLEPIEWNDLPDHEVQDSAGDSTSLDKLVDFWSNWGDKIIILFFTLIATSVMTILSCVFFSKFLLGLGLSGLPLSAAVGTLGVMTFIAAGMLLGYAAVRFKRLKDEENLVFISKRTILLPLLSLSAAVGATLALHYAAAWSMSVALIAGIMSSFLVMLVGTLIVNQFTGKDLKKEGKTIHYGKALKVWVGIAAATVYSGSILMVGASPALLAGSIAVMMILIPFWSMLFLGEGGMKVVSGDDAVYSAESDSNHLLGNDYNSVPPQSVGGSPIFVGDIGNFCSQRQFQGAAKKSKQHGAKSDGGEGYRGSGTTRIFGQ